MDVRGWAVRRKNPDTDPDQDNGPQEPKQINDLYDYLNYEVDNGRMTPNQAASTWNEHAGREPVQGDNNTRLKSGSKFDLQEYIYQQETGNLHSSEYYQGKAALWSRNAKYYVPKYGKTEYNRYVALLYH